MTKVLVLVILLLTLETTCTQRRASGTTPRAPVATPDAVELEILRAVFEYQMQQCYSDRNPDVYFLSYKERDPADNLLKSLSTPQFAVQPRSRMVGFRDRSTAKPGILLAVQDITLRTDTTA